MASDRITGFRVMAVVGVLLAIGDRVEELALKWKVCRYFILACLAPRRGGVSVVAAKPS